MSKFFEPPYRPIAVLAIASAAALGGACGGSASDSAEHGTSGGGGTTMKLAPGSWQMTGVVTEQAPNPSVSPCASVGFTLNVAADGSSYLATIGQDGFIDATAAKLANGSYELGGLNLPCRMTLPALRLEGTDADGDGKADTVSGTASATAFSAGGDVQLSEPVNIVFTGVPDVTAPTLKPQTGVVDPLFALTISASEPLAPSASLSLAGTTRVSLTAQPASALGDSVINWSWSTILPLGGKWQVQGTAQDLGGLALGPSEPVKTLADPGEFAQDGFEGPLVAAVESGTPTIITSLGNLPALSGAHSLWLEPGAVVVFHLRRRAAEQAVHFSARAFGSYDTPSFSADMNAGVVGGQKVEAPSFTQLDDGVDSGDAQWPRATTVQHISLPLSEAGTDVLVRLAPTLCNGFCAPNSPLMIDDLTLE